MPDSSNAERKAKLIGKIMTSLQRARKTELDRTSTLTHLLGHA